MVGDVYLVAPVFSPGLTQVTVYLPMGLWTHWWTNATYGSLTQGVTVTVAAPLGQPAAFIASGHSGEGGSVRDQLRMPTHPQVEGARFRDHLLQRLGSVPSWETVLPLAAGIVPEAEAVS
jgi:hypothetical protein